jgi:tetratricopeptide (TPR) repeat protein
MLIAWRSAGVLVTSLAVVCLTACGGAQSRFASHMKRGQAYITAGDATKASIEFRNALQIEPKSIEARLAAGRAAEKLQRPRDAYGLYQSVVDSSPENVEAREDLGRLLVYSGAAAQALKIIEPAIAKHPDNPTLLTLRATCRAQLKNLDGAIADTDQALKLAPNDEDAIEVRAGLYKQTGNLAAARTLVEGAVTKSPGTTSLYDILVDLDLAAGDVPHAEEDLIAVIKRAPEKAQYRYRLAVLYSRTNKLDEAQQVLEAAVQALPKSDDAKLTLVDFLLSKRTPAQAQQTLRGFLQHASDDYVLTLGLGALLQRSGSTKEAVDVYNDVVRRDGTGSSGLVARDRLADIAWEQGHNDEALRLVTEVLQKNARDNDALARRAAIELSRADPASAIVDLRAVLRDHPQSVPVQRMLAQAYVANGQPALAEQGLHAALDVAPKDTGVRAQLAKLLIDTQRSDQAVALLEDAVQIAPKDTSLRVDLIRAYLGKRDFEAARRGAEDLKTMAPGAAAGYYLAGMAAVGQDKPVDAQKQLEHALQIQPRAFDALSALVRLHLARGEGPQALALVESGLGRDPNSAPLLNLLGELYLAQKNPGLAMDAFTRATVAAPKWWIPYRNLAFAKLTTGDVPGATAAYETALKSTPGEVQLVTELASIYETHNRVDDAIALYDGAYRRNPHASVVANNLAMLLVSYKTDRADLDRARDLTAEFASSDDGTLLDTNGWVHFKRGEYAQALPVLGRAADRAPNSKEIRYHLGMAELHAGETDRARVDLESAVSGSAKFFGADEARVTLASLKSSSG